MHSLWQCAKQATFFLASGLLLSGAVLAGSLLAVRLSGRQIYAVQTNSMQPVFRAGDAVLVNCSQLPMPGEIVSYRSLFDDRVIISHWLLALNKASGEATTKGDALGSADPLVPTNQIVGKVAAVLPHFGQLLGMARRPQTLLIFVYIPAILLAAIEAQRLVTHLLTTKYQLKRSLPSDVLD